jgi:hypothetical protein
MPAQSCNMNHRIAYINNSLVRECLDGVYLPDRTVFVALQVISSRSWRVFDTRSPCSLIETETKINPFTQRRTGVSNVNVNNASVTYARGS